LGSNRFIQKVVSAIKIEASTVKHAPFHDVAIDSCISVDVVEADGGRERSGIAATLSIKFHDIVPPGGSNPISGSIPIPDATTAQ
jgi:hypothetical protein